MYIHECVVMMMTAMTPLC